jgi:hypothetical protein
MLEVFDQKPQHFVVVLGYFFGAVHFGHESLGPSYILLDARSEVVNVGGSN